MSLLSGKQLMWGHPFFLLLVDACIILAQVSICPHIHILSKHGLALMAAHGLVSRWEEYEVSLSWVLFPASVAKLGQLTLLWCVRNLDFKAYTVCQTLFPQTEPKAQEESPAHRDSSSFWSFKMTCGFYGYSRYSRFSCFPLTCVSQHTFFSSNQNTNSIMVWSRSSNGTGAIIAKARHCHD